MDVAGVRPGYAARSLGRDSPDDAATPRGRRGRGRDGPRCGRGRIVGLRLEQRRQHLRGRRRCRGALVGCRSTSWVTAGSPRSCWPGLSQPGHAPSSSPSTPRWSRPGTARSRRRRDGLGRHPGRLPSRQPHGAWLRATTTSLARAADLTPDAIGWLASVTGLPVVVKGVLRADDARRAVEAGAAAVWVSNHGGRQLDGAIATRWALPEVVDAVQGRAEVYVDGGLRRGTDLMAAYALGARRGLPRQARALGPHRGRRRGRHSPARRPPRRARRGDAPGGLRVPGRAHP